MDRERELAAVEGRLARPSSLSLVYGQRRAGKTFLLQHALADDADTIYFLADESTPSSLLARFHESVAELGAGGPAWRHLQPADWGAALTVLIESAAREGKRLVLVLDEVQYLIEAEPALPSILQRLWDETRHRGSLHLVLCGSALGTLQALGDVGQPLHGRFDLRLKVRPFDYFDAARFAPGWDPADRFRLYGVFGGLARHLAEVDPTEDLPANAIRAIVDGLAPLHEAPLDTLRSEHLSDHAAAHAIVSAIAAGENRFSAIASRTGLRAPRVDRVLKELAGLELVSREVRFGDRPGSRYSRYGLTDPFAVFWFRHVRPQQSALLGTPPERLWSERIAPRLDDHMGPTFERIVAQAFLRGQLLDRVGPVDRLAGWWSRDGQAEIDLVVGASGRRLYVECKWRPDGVVGLQDLQRLRGHLDRARLGPGTEALATAGTFSSELREVADREGVLLIGPEDLLGGGDP